MFSCTMPNNFFITVETFVGVHQQQPSADNKAEFFYRFTVLTRPLVQVVRGDETGVVCCVLYVWLLAFIG